jgi:hypothetical protein
LYSFFHQIKSPKSCISVKRKVYIFIVFFSDKPVIDKPRSSSTFKSWNGNSIRLKCIATGLPTPRISWYKPTNQQITSGINILSGGSELTVDTTLDQGDYGQYKCRATNIVGSGEHIINVTQLCKYYLSKAKPNSISMKEECVINDFKM